MAIRDEMVLKDEGSYSIHESKVGKTHLNFAM